MDTGSRLFDYAVLDVPGAPRITIDMDTGAEADLVDADFARTHGLIAAPLAAPAMFGIGGNPLAAAHVVNVPLRITDSRGTTRSLTVPCSVVDRKGGSPVLFSMVTLTAQSIHLDLPSAGGGSTSRWLR